MSVTNITDGLRGTIIKMMKEREFEKYETDYVDRAFAEER